MFLFSFPVYALQGTDTSPGDSCSVEDSVRLSANPFGKGAYVLTCKSGVWVASFSVETPSQDEQLANKAYVDSNGGMSVQNIEDCDDGESPVYSAATGDWWCPWVCDVVGEKCADGSIFAGDTNLFVTDIDQSTSSQWKTSKGADDINPDSTVYGLDNHDNRSGTLSDFPAFELCENLTRHGHSDWYLPAKDELNVLYTNHTAIGGFTTNYYWSSSEYIVDTAWEQSFYNGIISNGSSKNFNRYVRCVRRD